MFWNDFHLYIYLLIFHFHIHGVRILKYGSMGIARIIIDKNCKVFTRVCTPLSFEVVNKKQLHIVTFAFKLSVSQLENHFLALYVFHFTNFTNLSFLNDFYVPWTQIKTNHFCGFIKLLMKSWNYLVLIVLFLLSYYLSVALPAWCASPG